MPAGSNERVVRIGPGAGAPRLSVLTPFHRHDPSELLRRLSPAPADVEFVLIDDGSANAALLANAIAAAHETGVSARVIVWERNGGRAAARNRLIQEARGEYVLLLDADMLPDTAAFLPRWLAAIRRQRPVVAFGGLSLRHAERTQTTALHHNLFARSDCRDAASRQQSPAQFTASANLLVRRDFLLAHPFDDKFVGWGFEDVDWALRAARHAPILHIDNPATHAGLDSVDTLMRKSAEAGPNFALLAQKHPGAVSHFAAHRAARALQAAPGRQYLKRLFALLTRLEAAPMALRRTAFKLYRASHYAEHLA
jgi:glycosyltransferase involved in cell wall biosynthesis